MATAPSLDNDTVLPTAATPTLPTAATVTPPTAGTPTPPSAATATPPATGTPTPPAAGTSTPKKKKRGNQGKIRGPQLVFLQSRIEDYLTLSGKKERSKWIVNITHEYFEAFPWHMRTEPEEFAVLSDANATLSSQERQDLEKSREEIRAQTIKQGQVELKNWIHRQTQRPAQRNGGEAFRRINNQLKQSTKLKRPRRKPDFKHFMSHPEYRDQFHEYYRDATASNPPSKAERIKRQCELAEELYNEQPDEVKQKIAFENSAQHSSRVSAFKKLLSGNGFSLEDVDELTEAEKQLCHTNLLTFIQPLLDAIRAHTGLWLTFLAGAPHKNADDPKSDFAVIAISSGTVQGLKFHEYNSDDFNTNVMKTFLLFLNEAAKKPKSADAVDKSQLDDPSLISIPEPDPSSQPIPEPEPSTERAKRIANRNANKRSEPDHNEEEEDEEEYDEEDDEEEEDEEEEDEEEEDEEGEEEDELILRIHPNTLKKVHPESILYLKDASVSIKERRIAVENLTARQSAYEFNRQNNILRNRWNMSQITGGRTGSDIIKNGFRTPTPSPSSCVSTEKPVPTSTANSSAPSSPPDKVQSAPNTSIDSSHSAELTPASAPAPKTPLPPSSNSAELPVATRSGSSVSENLVEETPSVSPSEDLTAPKTPSVTSDESALKTPVSPSEDLADTIPVAPPSSVSPSENLANPTPVAPPAPSQPVPSQSEVDLTACPTWLHDAYTSLTGENGPQDPLWHKTLCDLVTLERYHEFNNPNGNGSTFPSTGRPKAFAWWFQNRKPVTRLPPDDKFGSLAEFTSEWWGWYSIINPEWRERDAATGRIVVNGSGEGDWEQFDHPGQNGMLSLVVSLNWWYQRLDSPSHEWSAALRDVSWVISELVKAKRPHHRSKANKRTLPDSSDGEEELRYSRRLRTRPPKFHFCTKSNLLLQTYGPESAACQRSIFYVHIFMDSSTIFISDDEDSTETSLTETSLTMSSYSPPATRIERPACAPPVYESSSPTRRSGRKYRYYVVFVGDQPGCYGDWADASARVTNFPGNMHKGYDTYEQALSGWRQHCHGFHKHPPGFVDGTMFVSPDVPESPPPVTPPPAKINTTSFPVPHAVSSPATSPTRTSSHIHPSTPSASSHPSSHTPNVDVQTPQRPVRIWAIHSPRFNSIVSSSAQADKILARAMEKGEEVEFREVDGIGQAEDWFGSLSLDE